MSATFIDGNCIGGTRCLCQTCTAARLERAITPAPVTVITAALDAEAASAYWELAVDGYARRHAAALAELKQVRERLELMQGSYTSMWRRTEQVLLHRWRSRIWVASVTSLVWWTHTGGLADFAYAAWQTL